MALFDEKGWLIDPEARRIQEELKEIGNRKREVEALLRALKKREAALSEQLRERLKVLAQEEKKQKQ